MAKAPMPPENESQETTQRGRQNCDYTRIVYELRLGEVRLLFYAVSATMAI